jgi:hypothetical protein
MKDQLKIEIVNTYLTDKNLEVSLLNKLDFIDSITEDDYSKFIITEYYANRLDLISADMIGDKNLYIFIMWLNNIEDFEDHILNEVIGTGDGSSKNYNSIELDYSPIKESTAEITFTISGIEYTVTDDGSGNFIDNNIEAGTIDYINALLNLKFNYNIDNLKDITISYERDSQNLKAGQELLIPTYNFIYNYYMGLKKERGLN